MMQSPPRAPATPVFPERRHGSLRMVASSCIVSAWLSLILSILFGIGMLATPAPTLSTGLPGYAQPSPYGTLPGETGVQGILGALPSLATGLRVAGGVVTIAGGILTFFFLAALGQGIYVLLDMEENTRITAQALAQIARRMGS